MSLPFHGRVLLLALGLALHLLLLNPSQAFVCPPETEQKEARLEGELEEGLDPAVPLEPL